MAKHFRAWTTAEEAYVRDNFRSLPIAKIARNLERTLAATRTRARQLQLFARKQTESSGTDQELGRKKRVTRPDR